MEVPQITTERIKQVYGDDVMMLFKGQEPFMTIKTDVPAGVLLENSEGKVVCYICKQWFEQLGTHLRKHQITAGEYKENFGFNRSAPLCSRQFSQKQSKSASVLWSSDAREGLLRKAVEMGKAQIGRPIGSKNRVQKQNHMNTCQAQILERLNLLVNKYGFAISERQAREVDGGLVKYAFAHYGGWSKFKETFGLEVNLSSQKKEKAELIYELRAFVAKYKRSPWTLRGRRIVDFPFSQTPYIREFGSMKKAWLICGVRCGQKYGVLIN